MKATNTSSVPSLANIRLVLILIGVVTALMCMVALGLELNMTRPVVSGHQPSSWFSPVLNQAVHWVHAVLVALI